MDSVKLYHIELVRDRDIQLKSMSRFEQAAEVFHELLDRSPVEQLAVIHLDAGANMIGVEKVGMGTMTSVSVTMGEIFRGALIAAATTIVLGHNHTTNNLTPSKDDWNLTDRARDFGEQLGVFVGDHIIVTPDGKHVSMKQLDMVQRDSYMQDILALLKTLPPSERAYVKHRAQALGLDLSQLPEITEVLDPDYQEGEIFSEMKAFEFSRGGNVTDLFGKVNKKKSEN